MIRTSSPMVRGMKADGPSLNAAKYPPTPSTLSCESNIHRILIASWHSSIAGSDPDSVRLGSKEGDPDGGTPTGTDQTIFKFIPG